MRNYIKNNCLSVGYNNSIGQPFFDLLQKYRMYIHSYFFSVSETYLNTRKLNTGNEIAKFDNIDTYNIPANVIFNSIKNESNDNYKCIINELTKRVNLRAITVIDPEMGIKIKEKYPDIEIHISTRYFDADWNYIESKHGFDFVDKLKLLEGKADVVNLSQMSVHDYEIQKLCRSMGFKIKFIVNEGCIFNLHFNYSHLPECENISCYNKKGKCGYDCILVTYTYPFMELARTYLYKEELKYMDYDILKLKSRQIKSVEELERLISPWISPHRTKLVSNIRIENDDAYSVFEKFIRDRSRCNHMCAQCMKCEEYYNKLIELGEVIPKH